MKISEDVLNWILAVALFSMTVHSCVANYQMVAGWFR